MFYIDGRDCVLCQFVESVTFALCAFIFALRNIALAGYFFVTTGGMGRHATSLYKRIASLLLEKTAEPYNTVMAWLRCQMSFALLRSSIMCIRGSRSLWAASNHMHTSSATHVAAEAIIH